MELSTIEFRVARPESTTRSSIVGTILKAVSIIATIINSKLLKPIHFSKTRNRRLKYYSSCYNYS